MEIRNEMDNLGPMVHVRCKPGEPVRVVLNHEQQLQTAIGLAIVMFGQRVHQRQGNRRAVALQHKARPAIECHLQRHQRLMQNP